jgi:hypothetical protein
MIRRLTWLVLGAVLGITGYRKAARLLRGRPAPAELGGDRRRALVPSARRLGAGSTSFVRDVRVGMAEYLDAHGAYLDRQARRLGNTLVGQQARQAVAGTTWHEQP